MTATVDWLDRPLPLTIAPYPKETIDSFIRRLAVKNRLDPQGLRIYITSSTAQNCSVSIVRLARISGQRSIALQYALPGLQPSANVSPRSSGDLPRPGSLIRQACCRCVAAKGISVTVICHLRPDEILCRRHLRWIGAGHHIDQQPYLGGQPQILIAGKHHRRLLTKLGRERIEPAQAEASYICAQWRRRREHTDSLIATLRAFQTAGIGTGSYRTAADGYISDDDPVVEAAAYPQVVALTRMLASPYWRSLPIGDQDDLDQFLRELRRTVAPQFNWTGRAYQRGGDPLVNLILHSRAEAGHPTV